MSLRLGMAVALADAIARLEEARDRGDSVERVLADLRKRRKYLARQSDAATCRAAAEVVRYELWDALRAEDVEPEVIARLDRAVKEAFGC